jgi:methylglutaconyl-CoA hydratase
LNKLAYLEYDIDEKRLAYLVLNRPEKMNALSKEMILQLQSCLDELSQKAKTKSVSCVIVKTNQPKAFCAGADLSERIAMNSAEVSQTLASQRKIMDSLAALECVTIASVQGLAFGGGLELALSCDLRIAATGAQMGLTETKLAIIPGAGGTQRLTRLLGVGKSKELIFRGRRLSAEEAFQIGLVNEVASDSDSISKKWGKEICEAGPVALVAAKQAIDGGLSLSLSQALDHERSCYEKVLNTEDRIEGLKAFSEKRKPNYKGN